MSSSLPPWAVLPLLWLARVNLGVAVFNCLPGYPLDGGRMLRAVLWHIRRDFASATITSARVGKGLGWTFVGLGVLDAFGGRLVNGLWLTFVGWFLVNAAAASLADALRRPAGVGPEIAIFPRAATAR